MIDGHGPAGDKEGSIDQNCFSVLEKAKATAKEAKAAHNYTDTAGFTLK